MANTVCKATRESFGMALCEMAKTNKDIVVLDADLAAIYGYETRKFNEQVKHNIEKFDDDFRFQLTKEEYHLTYFKVKKFDLKVFGR